MIKVERLDTIEITDTELIEILKWRDNNKELLYRTKPLLFEGVLQIREGFTIYFTVDEDMDGKFIGYYKHGDTWVEYYSFNTTRSTEQGRYEAHDFIARRGILKMPQVVENAKELNRTPENTIIEDTYTAVLSTMCYIQHFKKDIVFKIEKVHKKQGNSKHKKGKKCSKNTTVISKRLYVIPENTVKQAVHRRKYTPYTDSWSVLGHYRKLKSGRVIYVKPYIKGKGRKKAKTYLLNLEVT